MSKLEVKNLSKPDETRPFPAKGKAAIVKVGDVSVMRAEFEPGWKWSEHIKPIAKTESCQVAHVGYVISGRMKIVMDDGSQSEVGPGDAFVVPPGHDAWIVGKETCVVVDFGAGSGQYARKA